MPVLTTDANATFLAVSAFCSIPTLLRAERAAADNLD